MSSVPSSSDPYIESINRELNQLFPFTAPDLKVYVTAMKAFLEKRDLEDAQVQKLQSLKERLLQNAMTETPEKIEQVFNEQITKRIKRYDAAVKQMNAIKKRQRVFNESMNVETVSSSPVNASLEQIQQILKQDFPLSGLATLEACALITLAKPLYEEKSQRLSPDLAVHEAVQEANKRLEACLKENSSINVLKNSLSGSIIRCPAYLAQSEQVNGKPCEYFERDEIEEFVLKWHKHPYELDPSGSKRDVSMEEIQIDTVLENDRKEAFTQVYRSILENSDLPLDNIPDLLIHTVKDLAISHDKWSPVSVPDNTLVLNAMDTIFFGDTPEEKLIIAALIALASSNCENNSSPETVKQSMDMAVAKLHNRFEQDPVLSHYKCTITYALLQDPICINGLHCYEAAAVQTLTKDPLTRANISSRVPATELKNFIRNRIKEICAAFVLFRAMPLETWNEKKHFLELPATCCAEALLPIGKEDVIEVIRYLERKKPNLTGRMYSLKEIILSVGSFQEIDLNSLIPTFKKDKDVVLAAVRQNGLALQYADAELKKDEDVVLAAVRQNGLALQYADAELKKNKDIVLEAVRQSGGALEYADAKLKKDKDVVLAAVRQDGFALQFVDAELKKNKDIVLAAVRQDGFALQFVDAELKKNKDIVLAAVRQNPLNLQYADAELKKDKDVVLEAVRQSGGALEYADAELKKDKDVVLAAVRQDGFALQFVDAELKKDKDIVLEAVRKYGLALEYADAELKKDKDVVLEAVRQNVWALRSVDAELKKDKDVVLEAVRQSGGALEYADAELKKDKDVVLEAVRQNGGALEYADAELKKDKSIVLAAIQQIGLQCVSAKLQKNNSPVERFFMQFLAFFQYANAELKKDKSIVLTLVQHIGTALQYADAELKKDKDVVLAAVKQNGTALQYADAELKKDKDVVLAAVKQNGTALQYADAELKKDKDVVLEAVKQRCTALQYADAELKKNKDIVLEAVRQNGLALQYADAELKKDKDVVLEAVRQNVWALRFVDVELKKNKDFVLKAMNANKHIYFDLSIDMQKDLEVIRAYFQC